MREIGRDGQLTFVSSSQQQTSIVVRAYWNFIRIHPIVFTITEIQTRYVNRQTEHFNATQQCAEHFGTSEPS